jgi:hypothetical protein
VFRVAVTNLNDKRYWETQNYFGSSLPGEPVQGTVRIDATPGAQICVTVGLA